MSYQARVNRNTHTLVARLIDIRFESLRIEGAESTRQFGSVYNNQ